MSMGKSFFTFKKESDFENNSKGLLSTEKNKALLIVSCLRTEWHITVYPR